MSLGNWGQSFLNDAAGAFFGRDYLRDYTHASKTFRSNSYQNAPKLKFLFHTYFETNLAAFPNNFNYGLLVKNIKLPSFKFDTHQLNQYNRKRIVQTKIKYDPIEITFHDDNNDSVNLLWNTYYQYYYNDGLKPEKVLPAFRGSTLSSDLSNMAQNYSVQTDVNYNSRNIYEGNLSGQDNWGFSGGANSDSPLGQKVAFFKNITVFGFNQHNFTAYTLVNPIITNFSHDSYSYDSKNGTMESKLTVDYETVVYNYGALDGRNPGSIVSGFGESANYDNRTSPISQPGSNGTILGKGGLVDGVGGTLRNIEQGNILGAIKTGGTTLNTLRNTNLVTTATTELDTMLRNALQNTPNTRNTLFNFLRAGSTPGPTGTANYPTIGARSAPPAITTISTAGTQNNGTSSTPTSPGPIEVSSSGRASPNTSLGLNTPTDLSLGIGTIDTNINVISSGGTNTGNLNLGLNTNTSLGLGNLNNSSDLGIFPQPSPTPQPAAITSPINPTNPPRFI